MTTFKRLFSLAACLCLLLTALLPLAALAADDAPVNLVYLRPGNKPEKYDELIANVNAKLAEDGMNMTLEIQYVASDVFQDKVSMMLSSGDAFDLLCVMEDQKGYASYVAMDGLQPITAYLDTVGENLKANIPEYMWQSASISGEVYTIPAFWTDLADQANCITIDRANFKKYGIEKDPETREDLLALCDAYAANWEGTATPYVIPMFKEPFTWLFRTLETYPFTVIDDLIYISQDGKVKNFFETDEFRQCADFFNTLYEKGYISPDILSPTWSSWNQLCSGNFMWCDGCQMWGTEEYFQGLIPGCELDSIYLGGDGISAFRPASFRNSVAVSATSEHAEDAVRFMNWMYAEQDNYDAMIYGVEGSTFTNEGDHLYLKTEGTTELFNDDWMMGNLNFLRSEKGTYQTFIDIMSTEKADAVDSIIMNFTFDPANVSSQYTTCQALVTSDIYPVKLGIVKYDEAKDDVMAQLKAAGIDELIAEYQAQLDAYLAANP